MIKLISKCLLLLIVLAAPVLRAEYVFYPQYDSPGGNIASLPGKTAKQLKAHCDARPDCIAFNNMGDVKSSLSPTSQWNIWTDNPLKGLYRKVPDYTFTQGQDSQGGDLANLSGQTVPQLKVYCADNPSCNGFNTKGDLKSSLTAESQWTSWSTDPKQGLYTKNGSVPADLSSLSGYSLYKFDWGVSEGNLFSAIFGSGQSPSDEELRDYCDNDPTCVAYSDIGIFRERVATKEPFPSPAGPNDGTFKLYVKNNPKAQVSRTPSLFQTTADITDDYVFYQGLMIGDSPPCSDDFSFAIRAKCTADPNCVGFDRGNQMYNEIQLPSVSESGWEKFSYFPSCGTYIKTTALPGIQFKSASSSGYTFYQGLEAPGGSFMILTNHSIEEMKAFCDIDPRCDGFNTYGWIKTSLRPKSEWFKWTDVPGHGFYQRNTPGQVVGYPSKSYPGYIEYPGYRAETMEPFQDIPRISDCTASPDCQGSSGYYGQLIKSFSPKSTWTHYTRDEDNFGITIKESVDAQLNN